jgi:23S rRNA C2498 (ribose-2'-O)-methylase RlmM
MAASFGKFWIAHVDRAAVAAWRGAAGSAVGEELGEGFWRVDAPVAPHPLVRFAMPVEDVWPLDVPAPGEAVVAVAIRRHGRFAAERLGRAVVGYREPVLQALCADKQIFVCKQTAADSLSPFPAGKFGELNPDAPSRAGAKLEEAIAYLAAVDGVSVAGKTWLELGAFPGGMSAALAAAGAGVIAVDLRERPPGLSAGVRWHAQDVETFATDEALDGLACDLNGPHLPAARTVARLAATLRPGAPFVHTLKLSRWDELAAALAETTAILSAANLTVSAVRHLCANRQELTLIGHRSEMRLAEH